MLAENGCNVMHGSSVTDRFLKGYDFDADFLNLWLIRYSLAHDHKHITISCLLLCIALSHRSENGLNAYHCASLPA